MIRSLVLVVCGLTAALPAAAERVMVGYYANFGNLPVEEIPWEELTHLCHLFLPLDAEGKAATSDATPNGALTAEGRKHGVPVLVTVGGGAHTLGALEKFSADEEAASRLATDIVRVVVEGKYDGVDLHWVFPRDAATGAGHARVLAELRRQLDAEAQRTERATPYLLTTVVAPSADFGQWIDVEKVAPLVDWLGVQAYDMADPWSQHAAHAAPLFPSSRDPERKTRSVSAAMRYWERQRQVPKDKLVMGVPLFGRSMPIEKPFEALDPDLKRHHRVVAFSAVRELIDKGWIAEWDKESRAPWLSSPPAKQDEKPAAASPLAPVDPNVYEGPVLIGYDDRNSVHGKAVWAQEQGYRGMYFWALHQDRMPDGRHWLLDAANAAWAKQ